MAKIVDDRDLEEAVPRHVQLANAVVAGGMKIVDGTPCVPDAGGAYQFGWEAVNRALFMADQCSSMRTRKEACATLRFLAPEAPAAHWRYIAFANGVLDARTGELVSAAEFAAKGLGIAPAAIPHIWDPDAPPDEAVETLLEGVSCGDAFVRANLEEIWGLCMSRLADDRARAAWLYGEGQNGKSNGRINPAASTVAVSANAAGRSLPASSDAWRVLLGSWAVTGAWLHGNGRFRPRRQALARSATCEWGSVACSTGKSGTLSMAPGCGRRT